MISLLITFLCVLNACVSVGLLLFVRRFKASMPDIQQILNDVGGDISEKLGSIFEKPIVKASMSNLASKSHDARASNSLRNKVADKALGGNVLLKKALDYFDVTPLEGLELLNDPLIGPTIQGLMAKFAQGGQGLLGGLGGGGQSNRNNRNNRNNSRGVPLMS